MGNAALLLRGQGHEIVGSDENAYPPMSEVLREAGIEVYPGYDAGRLQSFRPDIVVVGNAVSRGNGEVEYLLDSGGISFCSLPDLIGKELLPGRLPVVITGTHGKTTTATMTAFLLREAGIDPGWLIGGVPRDLPGGARLGTGGPFVIEGDEYDSAFFDKRSKFIHYQPRIAAINNLEFDHSDIFRDLEDVRRSFDHFVRLLPASGWLLLNGDDPNLADWFSVPWTRTLRVGFGDGNDLVLADFHEGIEGVFCNLRWRGRFWTGLRLPMHGAFNARNAAMAVLAAALAAGHEDPTEFEPDALERFRGVRRRQDVLLDDPRHAVVEDFGHHPTAVRGTVQAVRAAYPDARLHVCFEPRSNTARTRVFEEPFIDALREADRVYLGAVHRAKALAPSGRLDTVRMAARLREQQLDAEAFADNATLFRRIVERRPDANKKTVWLFFTNGSFDGLPRQTAEFFAGRTPTESGT